jgi:hypothetical protein
VAAHQQLKRTEWWRLRRVAERQLRHAGPTAFARKQQREPGAAWSPMMVRPSDALLSLVVWRKSFQGTV